jgi:GTPase SAR1 family protein
MKNYLFTEKTQMVWIFIFIQFLKDFYDHKIYLPQGEGFFVIYDITNRISFEKIDGFVSDIRKIKGGVPIVLVGTKCDLEDQRNISKEEGMEKAKKLDIGFAEVSKFTEMKGDLGNLVERILEANPTNQVTTKENTKKECTLM